MLWFSFGSRPSIINTMLILLQDQLIPEENIWNVTRDEMTQG